MTFREFLQLCHPRFWMMNNTYSKKTDDLVKKAMSEGFVRGMTFHGHVIPSSAEVTHTDKDTGVKTIIWTMNYPYGYGTLTFIAPDAIKFLNHPNNASRPSRLTILRLKKRVDEYCLYYPEYCI